jgi:hypothetical protein
VTAQQAEALAEHDINDIDALASTSVDDLVEYLDVSLDEAETILAAAQAVVSARDKSKQQGGEDEGSAGEAVTDEAEAAEAAATEEAAPVEAGEVAEPVDLGGEEGATVEQHAVSAELDPSVDPGEVEPNEEMIAAGYDEAVQEGTPFTAEPNILAQESADPVAVTEAEPISEDELRLQDAGRDLRPDTITPAPDITSSGAAYIEAAAQVGEEEPPVEEDEPFSPVADFASEASAPEVQTTSAPVPQYKEEAATTDESAQEEKQDASPDAAQ